MAIYTNIYYGHLIDIVDESSYLSSGVIVWWYSDVVMW